MASLNEIRQKYPQYNDMSDQEFADKFHDKFYSDIPKEEYYKKIGFSIKEEPKIEQEQPQSLLGKTADLAQKYINEPVESSGLPSAAAGFLQGTGNIVPGIANLGIKAANLLPGVNIPEYKGFHVAPQDTGAAIGELGSFFTPGLLGKLGEVPSHISNIPHIANALKKATGIIGKSPLAIQKALKGLTSETGKSIGKNALVGAVMSPEDQGIGASLGGLGSAAGSVLGASIPKGLNKLGFGVQPGEETIKGLTYEDVSPSVEAAQRLGTPLRPSEASRNPFIAGLEGQYPRTREAAYENVELGMERNKSEKKAISNLLSKIYSPTAANNKEINTLYQNASRWNLKPEIMNQLKTDPLIKNALDEVSRNPAWKRDLGDTPENNIAYLDRAKRALYDKEKGLKVPAPSEAKQYEDARHNLVDIMDKSVPDYKKARELSELKSTRKEIKKKMKEEEIGGSSFFNKFIKNDNEFKKLNYKLRNRPEAQSMLSDMKDAWHSLINIEKPSTASYQSEKAINQARGSLQKVFEIWNQLTGKKKNLEAVKFIRSDKWIKKLQDAKDSRDKNRLESTLSDIMGKIFPGGFNAIEESSE